MATVAIKKGDNARELQDTLYVGSTVLDLTGMASAVCVFAKGNVAYRQTATLVGAATNGTLAATIPVTVYAVPGRWLQEWEITYANSNVITVPSRDYNTLEVFDDLG